MCRFIAYTGHSVLLDDILIKPDNSLIKQSIHARETEEPLNGDGFGLGWYAHDIDHTPGVFRSIRPAWNNMNLIHLAAKIKSSCFFAHIRAASVGNVTRNNCHPFYYKNFLFMHNGSIVDFIKIKRHLRRRLSDPIYEWVKGETDSEHFFALFIQLLEAKNLPEITPINIYETLKETIAEVNHLQEEHNTRKLSFLNTVITDGVSIVATRYVNDPNIEARTLYYAAGKNYMFKNDVCHMVPADNKNGAVLVVSEKLTDYNTEWHSMPQNKCLIVDQNLQISLQDL